MLKTPDNLLPFRFPATMVKYGPNFGKGKPGKLLEWVKHLLCLKLGRPVLRPSCISASLLLPACHLRPECPSEPTAGSGPPRHSALIHSPRPPQKSKDFPISCSSYSLLIDPSR